jgi:pyridinium-3,5-biscarboxylic acid mononucleotide synthase
MNERDLRETLDSVADGRLSPGEAAARLRDALQASPFEDLGFARVDHHREVRQGFPEVVFGQGKTPGQLAGIAGQIVARGQTLLVTRAAPEAFAAVAGAVPDATYHELPRLIVRKGRPPEPGVGTVLVAAAEEAAMTAEVMGNHVERLYDVGVAGLHRLLGERGRLEAARVLIVVAGMEGALPSVVGGLVRVPVIAVPTSVGYGASFQGLAALLGMLNSCATGVAVVNIDNGFGAGAMASRINHLR